MSILLVVSGAALLVAPAVSARPDSKLSSMRTATARFHSLDQAARAGYGAFHDVNGIYCIAMPDMGAMGVHYVNGALVGDAVVNPSRPEALVYAPDADGELHLAALEYIVTKGAWDAAHGTDAAAPEIFPGHPFNFTPGGEKHPNRYGLPDFYAQHVWVWKPNPAGLLAMWNPTVTCPGDVNMAGMH
jgi:hypothetical protein